MTPEFLLTSLVIVVSPGVGAIYTIAAGLARGGRAGVLAAFACTLGIVPHLLAAMTGLAALLHASALLFEMVRYAGVAYLLWMAWQVLRQGGALGVEAAPDGRSARQVLFDGVVLNLLNPKLSIFFFAFLPQFVSPADPAPLASMLAMSLVFMGMTFLVFAFYGLFAAAMRDRVVGRPRVMAWLRRSFAAAFVALGARLALAER
ncbi:MAG: LysE family translocator [Rhizobiaceae bacterium]|nr:LysE family translocator [Rhizobiaceae bacterium]MCV0408023.1 LysE family translocator [Rhizobiaceae bacterium]